MNRRLTILALLAVLMAMLCPALAAAEEDVPVNEADLLGVWQSVDNKGLVLTVLPGSYATLPAGSRVPQLYGYAQWRLDVDLRIDYALHLNRWEHQENSFLESLLGYAMANAVQSIQGVDTADDNLCMYDYTRASIGVTWVNLVDDMEESYDPYTDQAEGSVYAFHDDRGEVVLFWIDRYDPHLWGEELRRLTVETASAETLAQCVLRPLIDMAPEAGAQTALAVLRWAADSQCIKMDAATLADNLRAAYGALEAADAQAFRDHFAAVSGMMVDALGLDSNIWGNGHRDKPFEDAGLASEVSAISADKAAKRSADILITAVSETVGQAI